MRASNNRLTYSENNQVTARRELALYLATREYTTNRKISKTHTAAALTQRKQCSDRKGQRDTRSDLSRGETRGPYAVCKGLTSLKKNAAITRPKHLSLMNPVSFARARASSRLQRIPNITINERLSTAVASPENQLHVYRGLYALSRCVWRETCALVHRIKLDFSAYIRAF